jgi:hypothetical protein
MYRLNRYTSAIGYSFRFEDTKFGSNFIALRERERERERVFAKIVW